MASKVVSDEWTELLSKGHGETLYTVVVGSGSDILVTTKQNPQEPEQGVPIRSNDFGVIPEVDSDEPLYARAQTDGANVNVRVVGGINVRVAPRKVVSANVEEPIQLENPNDGSAVNPATEGSLTSTLPREVASPVGVEDSAGAQVDPLDESSMGPFSARATAIGTNAAVSPGAYGQPVTIVADTSGAATLTVEVSQDGGVSWDAYTVDIGGAGGVKEEVHGFADVRASVDQNLNALSVSAKGV